jgi:V/A-type H+-transporting ATPase subunit D
VARKVKLTRPELKRQRDALKRYTRYLPMLKLRQSQLQMESSRSRQELDAATAAAAEATARCDRFAAVLAMPAGLDLDGASTPTAVRTRQEDVAGISVPALVAVEFGPLAYSLGGTPPWVDGAITALREQRRAAAAVAVLHERLERIRRELKQTIQRVNLFERVMIPESREIIRRIRIRLGDEMTSAIGRGKIAKGKLAALATGGAGEDAA